MASRTFNRSEKLKSRKSIESLFRGGYNVSSPPFRMLYRAVEQRTAPALMTVAVPKRLIRNAVDRNLVKRRTREAYREIKLPLYNKIREKQDTSYEILFLYQSGEIADYKTIKNAVTFLLHRLSERISRDE
ncbi:MAG: ribonuclease P protein component [Bacteroidales bacterium]|nr:ribonuclease P protein component [Bacteroidales bacterium]